jgi:hypothetical protein
LHPDGTFGLQYSETGRGFFEFRWTYTRTGARVAFAFDGFSEATGTLRGDAGESLRVAYDPLMQAAVFVDGVYVRVP